MLLKAAKARKIKDSRGEATIEVKINGCKASSPSGKSKGKYETPSYHKSLEWNINFINKKKFNIEINKFDDLAKLEKFIKEKAHLRNAKKFGANALFALESAVLKALAKSQKKELYEIVSDKKRITNIPVPVGNAIGGGLHSHNKDHPTFQEFLLVPNGGSAKENVKIMNEVYNKLGKLLKPNSKNEEGAWQTSLNDEEILQILKKFKEIKMGIDCASSSFYCDGNYTYKNKILDGKTQIHYINSIIKDFNLFYVEDPLDEEDFPGFSKIKKTGGNLVVGDDLTVTHIDRLKKAIKLKSINAIIVKPNQNGSLLELRKIFEICRKNKVRTIMSHRSGETMDNALADYAVGFGADFIKCGISTKWREVKLDRLVKIEKRVLW